MKPIFVIADDITGAAEIAGIGYRYGLDTVLITDTDTPLPDCDLLVFATDTRSMNEEEAILETKQVIRYLKQKGTVHLFKKTDSALRGHIAKEIQVLLEETEFKEVLLLPQNPTKGRIIRNGIYYLNNIPLHETAFAYDPEFPISTSRVKDIIQSYPVKNAEDYEQVKKYVAQSSDNTLLAGAADLFTAYLSNLGYTVNNNKIFKGLGITKTLIVCGSTQSTSLEESLYVKNNHIALSLLPPSSFYKGLIEKQWIEDEIQKYVQFNGLILTTVGYPPQAEKGFALQLRHTMADIVKVLADKIIPHELVIEGGATAFTILKKLGWSNFRLSDEIAPGVIRMQCIALENTYLTLKPGSYSWGKLFD